MLLALSFFGACICGQVLAEHAIDRRAAPGSGTLFCGLAPSMDALIAARAIAGMGGGGCVFSPVLAPRVIRISPFSSFQRDDRWAHPNSLYDVIPRTHTWALPLPVSSVAVTDLIPL